MKKIRVFLRKGTLLSVVFAAAFFFGVAAGFAEGPPDDPPAGEGFDFTNDESVIQMQIDDAKKAKKDEEQQKRVVTAKTLARDMQEQLKLLQSAALCYAKEEPIYYNEKCTPAVRQLQSFKFNLQTLRGGQIQYKTHAERSAIMNASAQFDEFWPATLNVIIWCAETYSYQDFALKYKKLRALKRWYDEKKDDYIYAIKILDDRLAHAMNSLKKETNEAESGYNAEFYAEYTRQGFLKEYGLHEYAGVSGEKWIPCRKSIFFHDIDWRRGFYLGSQLNPYIAAHAHFVEEVAKFNPFFAKWSANIEKVESPYNSTMSKILGITRSTLQVFIAHGNQYEEIIDELQSSSGLGGLLSGEITSGNKYFKVQKGKDYTESLVPLLNVLWSQAEMYNAIIYDYFRAEERANQKKARKKR